jgi:hypothetical protein
MARADTRKGLHMKLDIGLNTAAHDRLLETLDNPRHRRIVANYRRHALLEVAGEWQQIFQPDMTIETPVYIVEFGEMGGQVLRGSQVHDMYRRMKEMGANIIVVTDEQIAVNDSGFGQEAYFHQYFRGDALRAMGDEADDLDAWYMKRTMVASFWPYDERARLIGEHGGVIGPVEITQIPESEVVTIADARENLLPQVHPLPAYDPVLT